MKRLVFFVTIIFQVALSYGQWNQTNFPDGETVYSIAIVDNTIIALADFDKIYRSTDGGQTWKVSMEGITTTVLYKLYRYNSGDQNIVYAATDKGVFKTENAGESWQANNAGISNKACYDIARIGDTIIACGEGKVYSSTNAGESWSEVIVGNGTLQFTVLLADDPRFFVATSSPTTKILYRSDNNGQSWVDAGEDMGDIKDLARLGNRYFAAGYPILFESNDQCATWDSKYNGMLGSYPIWDLCTLDTYMFIAAFSGVYVMHADSAVAEHVVSNLPYPATYFCVDANEELTVLGGSDVWVRPTSEMIGKADPKTIFVNQSNDSGIENGTATYPYNTIEEGLANCTNLDTLFIAAGEYNPDSLKIHNNIVIIGEGKENTIVNCSFQLQYALDTLPVSIESLYCYNIMQSDSTFSNTPLIVKNCNLQMVTDFTSSVSQTGSITFEGNNVFDSFYIENQSCRASRKIINSSFA